MRISRVQIEGFRSIESLEVKLDGFTALIGANGSGKSAVLHALSWFFTGTKVDEFDFRRCDDGTIADSFAVTVTIIDLVEPARTLWSKYIRNDTLELRRTAHMGTTDQLSGHSKQGPDFHAVRIETDTAERRRRYNELRALYPALPPANAKAAIESALDDWEAEATNAGLLVEMPDSDLSNAFGFNGKNLLQDLIQFVLVPASTRLEDNVDPAGKGGAIDRLLGAVVKLAADEEIRSWAKAHDEDMSELGASISAAVETASKTQMKDTNHYLSEMISGAEISLSAVAAPPKIQPQIDVMASFKFDGPPMPISRQGHGVQRSVMMSTLQAVAHGASVGGTPVLLAIEEPELYQHPARSVALAKALKRLTKAGVWQAVVATHSPSFIGTEGAASLRRFSKTKGVVEVVDGSIEAFAAIANRSSEHISKHLETLLPGELANAFFADRVLLVEGVCDQIVIGKVLEQAGLEIDANNWAIVSCEGKQNIPIAAAILIALKIDVRVVFDADSRGDKDDLKHQKATNDLVAELTRMGLMSSNEQFKFGSETTSYSRVSVLKSDVEGEESAWPSFIQTVVEHCGGVRTKNPYIVRTAASKSLLRDCPPSLVAIASMMQRVQSPVSVSVSVPVSVPVIPATIAL
jgi:putative ATP-dependent endonuclease of OLD family